MLLTIVSNPVVHKRRTWTSRTLLDLLPSSQRDVRSVEILFPSSLPPDSGRSRSAASRGLGIILRTNRQICRGDLGDEYHPTIPHHIHQQTPFQNLLGLDVYNHLRRQPLPWMWGVNNLAIES